MIRSKRDHRRRGRVAICAIAVLSITASAYDTAAEATTGTATQETAAPPTEPSADTTVGTTETTAEANAPDTTSAAPEDTSATTGTEPAPADLEPVTVAALIDDSGPVGMPGVISTVEATVEAINADGGLNGHPIELQVFDTRSDVAASQAAVEEIADDAVAVLLSTSPTETAISDSLSALGVPVLGVGYSPTVWGGTITPFGLSCESDPEYCANENFFTTSTTTDAVIAEQLVVAQQAGATKVAAAACAEVDSCASSIPVFEAIATQLGLEVGTTVRISSTAADYAAECIGFMQEGVDFIQVSASAGAAINLSKSCVEQGYEGSFGASAGSVRMAVLEGVTGNLNGGLNGFPWFVDEPLVQEYRDIMNGAGLTEAEWGGPHPTGLYAAMRLLQKAVSDHADPAAPLDAAATLAAMYSVDGEDLGGLLAGPVSYSEDNLDRTRNCFWPYIRPADTEVENPLGGLEHACFPAE